MPEKNSPVSIEQKHRYWQRNLACMLVLLVIWFLASCGCGILWAEKLNEIRMGGFKLGFWFAQQGSIYVFVVLIAVYVVYMNWLDHRYGVSEDDDAVDEEGAVLHESAEGESVSSDKE